MKVILIFGLLCPAISLGQHTTSALKATSNPVMDGDVLNDPAWANVTAVTTFTQKTPDEGQPISENTVVKVIYSEKTFYVSVVCFDSKPSEIVISDNRRDSPLNNSDSFSFIIDTFKDFQTGYLFGTNPAGIEYDAQITGGGEGGSMMRRFSMGTGGGFNVNWDAVWEVKTQRGDYGWSAEFAIPFKTLRYKEEKDQSWGINFERVIARKKEEAHWAPISRQFTMNRLVSAGSLTQMNVPTSRNIKIMPYILGQNNEIKGESSSKTSDRNFGLDGKISVGSSMSLDLTYNTDFAQVEADDQQINLDRFSLFFPEKRAFFLENAGLFSVGTGGGFFGPDIEMFFSRRIGVGPDGTPVPIVGGGRLTGTFSGMKVGMLSMRTDKVKDITDANQYSVLRLKKELPNRTHIGAMYTALDHMGKDGYMNQSYAFDAQMGIGELSKIVAFAGLTDTPGRDNDNAHAYRMEIVRDTKQISTSASYTEVGENFNPEMGYLKRENYKKWSGRIFTRFRPENKFGLLEIRPHINFDGYWKLDGFQESGRWHIDNHWEFRSGFEFHTGMNFTKEGVQEAFDLSDITISADTYNHSEVQIFVTTNQASTLSLSVMSRIGGYFGGRKKNFNTSIKYRFGNRFTSELVSNYNDVKLMNGQFVAHLIRARLTYAFSPSMYIQSLLQYNNQSDEWSMNWRFIWQQSAATGLYLVYNQTQDYDGIPIESSTKSFVLKYSYLFDAFQ
ncbi:MAG: carbohydrate binding family 9 domain-containing protein [Candidatus Marinimicrobia bacterium]|nr:carbohydrate binding family 9 domain-containing protein [Candidatus Neomarinimicrobiota bacterium]MBL7009696.1 carbohydrate binding family 9 domain-containing protein [Candidatus Neomarinimicrobiota bacterium]